MTAPYFLVPKNPNPASYIRQYQLETLSSILFLGVATMSSSVCGFLRELFPDQTQTVNNRKEKKKLLRGCRVFKKVGRDKDEMERWWFHIRKNKMSDMWLQKNTTHLIIDVATSFWTGFKNKELWSGLLKLMKERSDCFISCSPPSMRSNGFTSPKF